MDEPNQPTPEETPVVETAETAEETSAPPWGDDFDAQRAWDTIQTQRASEAELKEQQRQAQERWEDEQAHLEYLAERGYEFADDEYDGEYDDDPDLYQEDQPDPREERLARLEQAESQRLFNADLDELASGADVELTREDRELIGLKTGQYGNDRKALEKAFKERRDAIKDYEKQVIERYRNSKTTTAPPGGGKQATDQPDYDNMTASERRATMTERFLQGQRPS